MKILNNKQKLNYYIDKFNINKIFNVDMTTYMELHLFDRDEHIYKTNEKIDYFYFLVEGKAKVYILLSNGKSLLLMFCNPLRVLGDVEILDSDIANCNLQALKQCLCVGISFENLRRYAIDDPVFLKYMCRSLGEKLTKNTLSSSINLLYPLENRLASYILATTPEIDSPSDAILTQKLTEIAELLGTSYRHLIRVINSLCDRGIIKKDTNLIKVVDRDALRKLAGDLYQ